jgi:hypothetical protein
MKQNLLKKRFVVAALGIVSFSAALAEPAPQETTSNKGDPATTTNVSEKRQRGARTARNIRTGATIKTKAMAPSSSASPAPTRTQNTESSAQARVARRQYEYEHHYGLKLSNENKLKKASPSPTATKRQ